jgi:hypothetical protein
MYLSHNNWERRRGSLSLSFILKDRPDNNGLEFEVYYDEYESYEWPLDKTEFQEFILWSGFAWIQIR